MEAQRNNNPCPEKLDLVNKDGKSGSKVGGKPFIETNDFIIQFNHTISIFNKHKKNGFYMGECANKFLDEMFEGDIHHTTDFLIKNYCALYDLCPHFNLFTYKIEKVRCQYTHEEEYCFHYKCTHYSEYEDYIYYGRHRPVVLNYIYFPNNEKNMEILEELFTTYINQN